MDIRNYASEYPRWVSGVALKDALALGRGRTDAVRRTADSGIGETLWRASGMVRVVGRAELPSDIISLTVTLVDEPHVESRINPYAPGCPQWGPARPEHAAAAREALTGQIAFVMGKD